MKNAINYYYNLDIENIHQKNKSFYFNSYGVEYIFTLYEDEPNRIQQIYNIHTQVLQSGLYCHQIILNINNEPLTLLDGKYYILLKVNIKNRTIEYEDVVTFSRNYLIYKSNYLVNDWIELWKTKTDYIEYQVSQLGIKYPLISKSVSYYIGLSETAISYLKNHKIDKEIYSISHRRLKCNSTLFDLYNPVNFIIDLPIRDVCEYLKDAYFERNVDVLKKIVDLNLNLQDSILLFCRMIFPTYYFDAIESCIDGDMEEKEILKYINRVNDFEMILCEIMSYLKKVYNVESIEWLIKT